MDKILSAVKDYSLSYFSGSTFSDLPIQVENDTNRQLALS